MTSIPASSSRPDPRRPLTPIANRHPGHLDGAILDEVRAGLEEGRWKPLDLPGRPLVRIDTTSLEALDLDGVVARAADHIGGAQRT